MEASGGELAIGLRMETTDDIMKHKSIPLCVKDEFIKSISDQY